MALTMVLLSKKGVKVKHLNKAAMTCGEKSALSATRENVTFLCMLLEGRFNISSEHSDHTLNILCTDLIALTGRI